MKKINFIAYVMCALMVVGCSTMAGTGSILGAGGGGALGAILGQVIGKDTKSTVIGAAIGTAVGTTAGALIGKHMDKVKAKAAQVDNAQVTEITDQDGVTVGVKVSFGDILFDTGKYNLKTNAKLSLDDLADLLNSEPVIIDIQGHTDSTGSDAINNPLSENRANAVYKYLKNKGVSSSKFKSVKGYGSRVPVADNNTQSGRQKNRRVEIYMYPSDEMVEAAKAGTLQ